ncbi:hypothetical protein AVEN_17739-1 [Araneus ventricosus]|uniref:Uncharacterized protein n=1 Tax=Araneus ventricosus TaxID=182803 RepID=A0A4Y2FD94_ARAVE|nr:hypothetical protein AVEN_17739-1 [Araneus ventricosus]
MYLIRQKHVSTQAYLAFLFSSNLGPNFHAMPTTGCMLTEKDLAYPGPHAWEIICGFGFGIWHIAVPALRRPVSPLVRCCVQLENISVNSFLKESQNLHLIKIIYLDFVPRITHILPQYGSFVLCSIVKKTVYAFWTSSFLLVGTKI